MSIQRQQWQRELRNFKGIKSLFLFEGNVNDLYPVWDGGDAIDDVAQAGFLTLNELLHAVFSEDAVSGEYQLVYYDPLRRFTNMFQESDVERYLAAAGRAAADMQAESDRVNSFGHARQTQSGQVSDLVQDSRLIRALLASPLQLDGGGGPRLGGNKPGHPVAKPVAVVVDMASRVLTSPSHLDPDETAFFTNLFVAASDALRVCSPDGSSSDRNTLILVASRRNDLPDWFVNGNPNMRVVTVPNPDRATRELYVQTMIPPSLPTEGFVVGEKSETERFVDMTDAMTLRELDELRRMHGRDTQGSDLAALVDVYKYGLKENKWATMLEKLEHDPGDVIRRRVKGQDQAVDAVVSVLKRSVLGLSGATHSGGGKPKGVVFLSGPTGTGKTEIVKAVTEMLFGDERSCLRFDMSEYQGDNSDQKLFGAPPGYVGYSQGGQLTNAVRANPFSVVLFDEVEKASPSIMDKFLQILEDGRMTDGQGTTVYFSETLIFFTSNIGFSREVYDASGRHVVDHQTLIGPGEPYDAVRDKVMAAMKATFKPEFLGRIGNNVVVFDYIDDASAALIARQKVDQVNHAVFKQQGVHVEVDQTCFDQIVQASLSTDVKEKGGRGIANYIESEYLNTLAEYLFDMRVPQGATIYASAQGGHIVYSTETGASAWL